MMKLQKMPDKHWLKPVLVVIGVLIVLVVLRQEGDGVVTALKPENCSSIEECIRLLQPKCWRCGVFGDLIFLEIAKN